MENYIQNLNPTIKKYFNILSEDFPEFLLEYINTPAMQKQDKISISSGMYYSKMFDINIWYSSLDHSIAVALIIWNFTKDKKQTLAGLFHDISTPTFKHCIDFMNKDYKVQESTEDLTKTIISNSNEIMSLLKRDGINLEEVANYHIYPIADNDTPLLSADRLEYTLSNGLGAVKKIWDLDEIKEIYSNIEVFEKENKIPEIGFTDINVAKKFVEKMSILSICYMNDKRRFSMQFLADIIKKMTEEKLITVNDLYNLSEKEVVKKIEQCNNFNISECFQIWKNAYDVNTSSTNIPNKYCINIESKKRYINPLVKTENKLYRISEISNEAQININRCIEYDFDRYLYMDFNFQAKEKTLILSK